MTLAMHTVSLNALGLINENGEEFKTNRYNDVLYLRLSRISALENYFTNCKNLSLWCTQLHIALVYDNYKKIVVKFYIHAAAFHKKFSVVEILMQLYL